MAEPTRRVRWGDENVMIFIEAYKQHESLWNPSLAEYTDMNKREIAYQEIIRALNTEEATVDDIKRKIKSIRTTYFKELKKIWYAESNNCFYKPSMIWFETADSFLRQFMEISKCDKTIVKERAHNRMRQRKENKQTATKILQQLNYQRNTSTETLKALELSSGDATTSASIPTPTNYNTLSNHTNIADDTTNNLAVYTEDEFDLFARSISLQLRKLPELEALDLMQGIQAMVIKKKRQMLAESQRQQRSGRKRPRSPSPLSVNEYTSQQESSSDENDYSQLHIKQEEFL